MFSDFRTDFSSINNDFGFFPKTVFKFFTPKWSIETVQRSLCDENSYLIIAISRIILAKVMERNCQSLKSVFFTTFLKQFLIIKTFDFKISFSHWCDDFWKCPYFFSKTRSKFKSKNEKKMKNSCFIFEKNSKNFIFFSFIQVQKYPLGQDSSPGWVLNHVLSRCCLKLNICDFS